MTLANGATFQGLIVGETPAGLTFRVVRRWPGRPTMTMTTAFGPAEVGRVKRLTAADRQILTDRLAALDPDGSGERKQMDAVEFAAADWPAAPPEPGALRYTGDRFVLVSNAPEEVTRRAAVRLDQIFAAYERFLPPRVDAARPVTILLAGTPAGYRAALGPGAAGVRNPAVYEPAAGRIVCGSDLAGAADTLAAARQKHRRERAKVDAAEAELRQVYKPNRPDLDRFLPGLAAERDRLRKADRDNDAGFDRAAGHLFALLYHEAFHAYVATAVYPARPGPGELPRWLNEGLAQIFETAVLDGGELRVGHADPARLARVQVLVKPGGPGLVPVAELVRAGRPLFLAVHADQQAAADRAYLTAWALTFYLTFDRHRVGAADFPAYLAAVNTPGADPVGGFAAWVGADVTGFEAAFTDYVKRLRPDGDGGEVTRTGPRRDRGAARRGPPAGYRFR